MLRLVARYRVLRNCAIQPHAQSSTSARTQYAKRSVLPDEHTELQNKFKAEMQINKLGTAYDVVERIEWNGDFVGGRVFDSVLALLTRSSADNKEITDRQLSVILSVFGRRCDSISKHQRSAGLSRVLTSLNNIGVSLGPLSRTAVFAAQIDNGSLPSVSEELSTWISSKFAITPEICEEFSRVYALTGNAKAIGETIEYMKGENIPLREPLIRNLVYCFTKSGNTEAAESLVKKCSTTMNEVVLRCAIADVAVHADRVDDVALVLGAVPASAKLLAVENNKHVLELVCDLIERGHSNAFKKLSPFIYTSPDGNSLAENNNNVIILSRARRARSEGLLSAALQIYDLVHPNRKNPIFEEHMMSSLVDIMKQDNANYKDIISLAKKMEAKGILENAHLTLLEASVGTVNCRKIVSYISSKDLLQPLLNLKPSLKMDIGRSLGSELTRSKLSSKERASVISEIATVFFTRTEAQDPIDAYKIIFALAGNDVEYILKALSLINNERVRRELSTAAVQQVLFNRQDGLRYEKLDKLLESGSLDSISGTRVHKQLKELVSGREDQSERGLQYAAKLLSLAFPRDNSRVGEQPTKLLITLISDINISTSRLRDLVELLEKEPRVRLSRDDVTNAKTSLESAGLSDRSEFVERLKAQSQTYARWLQSSLVTLEEEISTIESKPSVNKGALQAVTEVFLRKLLAEKVTDFVMIERILRKIVSQGYTGFRIKKLSSALWDKGFMQALQESNMDVAEKFWEIKRSFSVDSALSYISLLYLHGKEQDASKACEELRVSAQTITGGSLELAGRLVASHDASKIGGLSEFLREKLHLKESQSRRIVAQIKAKQMNELIAKGDLNGALQLAVEETNATGVAFGQYELFNAAFAKNDAAVTEKVYFMIMNAHDKTIAILDLAYSMLENGHKENAHKLLQTNGLKISSRKLDFFLHKAVHANEPDVLRGLFFGLNSNNAAAIADLNKLLLQLAKLYYKSDNTAALEILEADVRDCAFPVDHQLKAVFDMVKQKKSPTLRAQ